MPKTNMRTAKRTNCPAESLATTELVPDTQAALAAAVTAAPDDDLPRLVMADWLDESGGEAARGRAEFIRLQVATCGRATTGNLARAEELLARYGRGWAAELGVRGHNWGPGRAIREGEGGGEWAQGRARFYYSGGFVESVTCSPERFSQASGTLFRWHPVRAVCFGDDRAAGGPADAGWLRPALARPEMRRVEDVSLSNSGATDRHLEELYGAETLADRIDLNVSAAPHLGPLAVGRLGRMGPGRLRAFWAVRFGCGVGDYRGRFDITLATALAGSAAGAVEAVCLNLNQLRNGGLQQLAGGRWRPRVLYVSDNLIGSSGVRLLVESGVYPGLHHLGLDFNWIGDDGAEAIAGSPASNGLRSLTLSATMIGDRGARSLADSPHLGGLEHLTLGNNPVIGEAARGALKERFGSRVDFW
jgi:uncharacterized protein (TIGR02996 family)